MRIPWLKWIAPPVYDGDIEKTAMARTLYTFLLMLMTVTLLLIVGMAIFGYALNVVDIMCGGAVMLTALALLILLRRGYVRAVGYGLPAFLWICFTLGVLGGGGIRHVATTGYFLVIVITLLIGDRILLWALTGTSVTTLLVAYYLEQSDRLGGAGLMPLSIRDVLFLVIILGASAFFLHSAAERLASTSAMAQRHAAALLVANAELANSRNELKEHTAHLQQKNAHLTATMVVAQEALEAMGDIDRLLSRVVSLVTEEFGYDHTGIFWIDASREWVVLQAASSEGGRRMLERGHRLRMGEGIVGHVAQQGAPRAAFDVGKDAFFFSNPNLPQTRSEMAVPLRSQGQVIGVLDVQSNDPRAFTSEDVSVLQALADQVSLAVTNARLLLDARQRLETVQRTYGEMAETAWQQVFQSASGVGFLSSERGTLPVDELWHPAMVEALETTRPVETEAGVIAVPVTAAGQVVAVVEVHLSDGQGGWTPERREMLDTLSSQLSQVLERARLYRDTQQTAMREQLLREISDEIGRASDMSSLMRITAEALNRRLGGSRVYVRLTSPEAASAKSS